MGPESERIASLHAGSRLLVFGFWTGKLPEISRLHFLTVSRALPPGSRYVLLVDEGEIPTSLLNLLSECRVDIVNINLRKLLCEVGLAKLHRQTRLSRKWKLARKYPRISSWLRLAHYDPRVGFDPRFNFLLGGPPEHPVMNSDYARVVVSSIVPVDSLYVDIDFAFTRSLGWILQHDSFIYRWERLSYGNSALMFVRKESPIKHGILIEILSREGTAKCRVLLQERNCQACGLNLLSCDRLDPLWSETNPSEPNFDEFFRCDHDSAERLRALQSEFDAVHWHNRWKETAEPGSPYDLWVRELSSPPASQN
jgi:hypothetical protein